MYEYSLPSPTRAYRMQRVREMNRRIEHREHVFEIVLAIAAWWLVVLWLS